ncbi:MULTISPECIES: SDR family NAD(P)-dependent oxidoreductase [Microbacterium]|jgi:NAD(P)-dependent dehydrogenase (short-subunit alcohol dehydrogenase family)|uniref:SDR family NAD(P)-dependent oxidoreductase n=1 Tax=Microbacterium TaxID=33882 RepID=UPI0010F4A7BF|nr:SDR family oxidoreductase [Microbacterium sp. 4NA327F11]MCK9916722.1 SDR family oxidoreductase [Microbacteriaceae bacterium K1510]
MSQRTILVVGGTSGIGLELARTLLARGDRVIITGRDAARAAEIAEGLGPDAASLALDISEPEQIAPALAGVGAIDGLVLAAIERDANTIADYDIARARRLVTLKLVGYAETVHALLDRLTPSVGTGIVLFGGRAKDLPYPGSTTVSTINGGVEGLTHTLALELAPIRVNALHPGIIGDSPFWAGKPDGVLDAYRSRTPGGELATVADVVGTVEFLLDNRGVSGTSLYVDRGWTLT